MSDLAAVKTRLEEQLAELRGRKARVETDLAEPLNADSSEQAVEMEDDAAHEGQAALIDHQNPTVSGDLGRREEGNSGHCVSIRGTLPRDPLYAPAGTARCQLSARIRQHYTTLAS